MRTVILLKVKDRRPNSRPRIGGAMNFSIGQLCRFNQALKIMPFCLSVMRNARACRLTLENLSRQSLSKSLYSLGQVTLDVGLFFGLRFLKTGVDASLSSQSKWLTSSPDD